MVSNDQKFGPELPGDEVAETAEFPQLRLPNREITDSGIVRLGNGMITANFPQLRLPNSEIADTGIVRLGNGMIAGKLPFNSAR
jgi:hypothetical protein